jgi:hypothetical protein
MIQRIQSIYLSLAIIALSIVSFGSPLFYYYSNKAYYKLTAFGLIQYDPKNDTILNRESIPFFWAGILVIILIFFTLLSYKKLRVQNRFAFWTLSIQFLISMCLLAFSFVDENWLFSEKIGSGLGIGFYIYFLTLPLLFLSKRAIKKDLELVDSLNRLR